jgi:hypothetical protein
VRASKGNIDPMTLTLPVRETETDWPEEVLAELQRDESTEAKVNYLPTPEEIRQACDEIQSGWDDDERQSRRESMPWQQLYDIICEQCGQMTRGGNAARRFCDSCMRDRNSEHKRRYRAKREAVTA